MFIFVSQDEGLVENDLEGEVNEKMLLRQQLYELREQRLVFSLSFIPAIFKYLFTLSLP